MCQLRDVRKHMKLFINRETCQRRTAFLIARAPFLCAACRKLKQMWSTVILRGNNPQDRMSALGQTDISARPRHVRFTPKSGH
jgi:hypothetical protein